MRRDISFGYDTADSTDIFPYAVYINCDILYLQFGLLCDIIIEYYCFAVMCGQMKLKGTDENAVRYRDSQAG